MDLIKKLRNRLTGNPNSEYFWNIRKNAQIKHGIMRYIYIYIYIYQKYLLKYNSFFPLSAKVENMPIFPHGLNGIFVSSGATIGRNCVIFHQVTIVSNTLADSKGQGAPRIGNNVYIGAGAKIIGNVVVGNNVRIGANCVVTKDVPDNTTVVSAPVRYITKDKPMDNRFTAFKK